MVKGLKVLVLVVSVFLIAGCMDYNINMSIHDDKSVDVNMSMKMDLYELVSSESMRGMVLNEFYQEVCDANCTYDESSSEYSTCVYDCLENYGTTEEEKSRIDEAIKDYLDEQLNSSEFNEDELFSDEDRQQLEDMGYMVETDLDKENYIYLVHISQHFNNIDDITGDNLSEVNLEEVFNGEGNNLFFSRTDDGNYQANYVWEMSDEDVNYEDVDISEFLTVSYEISLPYASISNNATTVSEDGRTLIWDLINSDTIHYEFSFDSPENTTDSSDTSTSNSNDNILKIVSICLIAGGVIGLIIVFIILLKNRKK